MHRYLLNHHTGVKNVVLLLFRAISIFVSTGSLPCGSLSSDRNIILINYDLTDRRWAGDDHPTQYPSTVEASKRWIRTRGCEPELQSVIMRRRIWYPKIVRAHSLLPTTSQAISTCRTKPAASSMPSSPHTFLHGMTCALALPRSCGCGVYTVK